MEMPKLSLLFSLTLITSLVISDPQILPLNRFSSLATSIVSLVEPGARLYLASIDDDSVLKNIIVTTGGNSFTLDTLNCVNNDGTGKSLLLSDNLWITTSNTGDITANLTGNLYLTSKGQADDPNFSVYVIKNEHRINIEAIHSTVVILNTWLPDFGDVDEPRKLSYVTDVQQASTTMLCFQWGIPPTNWQDVNTNNTFFMNPVALTNITGTTNWFFDHIEPLQIGLDYWYFTSTGPISMKIENKYINNRNYTTTSVNTTGLIVNNFIYQEHVVNFVRDDTRSGVSGLFVSAFIKSGVLDFYIQSGWTGISYELGTQIGWLYYAEDQATQLVVNTSSNTPGYFYCQYFSHAGQLYPLTTPGSTVVPSTKMPQTTEFGVSTTTVATSTKSSGTAFSLQLLLGLMLIVVGIFIFWVL